MIQKKIALVGAPGVGKTSLVRRFVDSLFDDTYLTTIGVKVDKKAVRVGGVDVTLMIWDVAGAEEHFPVPTSYIRGAAGYLLVVDGTRPETVQAGLDITARIEGELGVLPFIVAANKRDLERDWRLTRDDRERLTRGSQPWFETSARSGDGVEAAFVQLAAALVG